MTLEKHKNGIWITRLEHELTQTITAGKNLDISVEVVCLEFLLSAFHLGGANRRPEFLEGWIGIVNRVSDAADPVLYKACLAVLNAAKAFSIVIFNGPEAYAMCGNKWLHHLLFHKAGLDTPPDSFGLFRADKEAFHQASGYVNRDFPHLIKPNSGGFGAGMVRVENDGQFLGLTTELMESSFKDEMVVYQPYMRPLEGKIYRIWFLQGRVQCGVVRKIADSDADSEFVNGCAAAGTCRIDSKTSKVKKEKGLVTFEAFNIPADIVYDIEKKLLPSLPKDTDAGSVEFLNYLDDNCVDIGNASKRFYFDLNLLSTLPIIDLVSNEKKIWRDDYDPWRDLSDAIFYKILSNEASY